RGSWLDFEFDAKDVVYVRIDRRRKLPVTTFLLALDSDESAKYRERQMKAGKPVDPTKIQGVSKEEILHAFYDVISYEKTKDGWKTGFVAERYRGVKLKFDLIDAKGGKVKVPAGTKVTARQARKLEEEGLKEVLIQSEELVG